MKCPACSATLKTIDYEGIRIETCPSCEGEWLDSAELRHVVNVREVRFDDEERRAIAAATKITGTVAVSDNRALTCPKCGDRTVTVNYGGDTGIIIDKCPGCGGMWLDRGELEKIQVVAEGWKDGLPDELAKHGPRLRRIAAEVDERDDVKISRFGFVNAVINGILDVVS